MLPGGKRTRPLNIHAAMTRSMVETAKCGSSWPISCAAIPTLSVVLDCAKAGAVNATAEARSAARISMEIFPREQDGELAVPRAHANGGAQAAASAPVAT